VYWRTKRAPATARAYPRAAIVGNPSDGYGGRTIAFTFRQLHAEVTVKPAARLIIEAHGGDGALLRAAAGRFAAHCVDTKRDFAPCSIGLRSSIPAAVGLAASSAVIVATLRALCRFHDIAIEDTYLPTVALAAEEDAGIPAGLQDRVAQVYGGLVYMDFDQRLLSERGYGDYERLDPALLPRPYVAWRPRAGVSSAVFHGELRRRFRSGDAVVVDKLRELGELAARARDCLLAGDLATLGRIIDANFDARRELGPLDPRHVRMVEVAREVGASANYAGSGGAIAGLVSGPQMLAELSAALAPLGCTVVEPAIA
jgi:glucuronokinase